MREVLCFTGLFGHYLLTSISFIILLLPDKARFQLFGDTINTAQRIESTGIGGKVHISPQTAKSLEEAGQSKMYYSRKDIVHLKGKGDVQTFWLKEMKAHRRVPDSSEGSEFSNDACEKDLEQMPNAFNLEEHTTRLVDWNFEMLCRLLKQVVASRPKSSQKKGHIEAKQKSLGTRVVVHEVAEIISLPGFDMNIAKDQVDPDTVTLGEDVERQLYKFIQQIAAGYNQNPFHNFQHASHVAMSVNKLLSRIVAPDLDTQKAGSKKYGAADEVEKYAARLHDHTYGINSDPLTQFGIVLSALMHDMGHKGVPNGQLAKEEPTLDAIYKGKSLAEQHSVNLGWNLLMTGDFEALCGAIYTNTSELKRFRQIIVNNIMATDIFDKELSALRKSRWDKAFSGEVEEDIKDSFNRKATIVVGALFVLCSHFVCSCHSHLISGCHPP